MQTFDTPGSVSLQIKLPSGRVVVTTADEPTTTVEIIPLGRRGQDAIDEIEVCAGRHQTRQDGMCLGILSRTDEARLRRAVKLAG